ncbi:hypothetical protein SLEP1_g23727 [Rubroshorea leprosula]|uniref:PGG domain-containing protein n=1 Tax=Rubroshorea leprosula TaxID=152421 RepID=A0AAV5JKK2_9ROSI|nr:hypothetical protein SLEP1_g23727 [Rubroshorea leprosula]
METVAPNASVIVPEVLKRNNYERWSIFLEHYLVGQDLWDVVEFGELSTERNMGREWIKKNALALHAIKISCGEEMFEQIKEMKSAKDVWDALAAMYKPADQVIFEPPLGRPKVPGNLTDWRYETLINAISSGELGQVQRFFRANSNPISRRIFENGYTALHFAVYNGRSKIVDYLIEDQLSKEDLETEDYSGSTALSIAARCGVGKSIAQSLVRKNYKLLTIPDNDGKIPVELASSTIQEDTTRYLYRETPLESLNVDRGFYILQECITRKMFGIIVKAHVIKEHKHRSCVKMRDFFQSFTEEIQQRFVSWAETLQLAYEDVRHRMQEPIQETEEMNLENQQTIQEIGQTNQETNGDFQDLPFKAKCALAVEILLTVLVLLGIPIVVALRLLVSMLSRILAKNIYAGKLMDKYACEVIRLICQPLSLSDQNDQNLFVQSDAVDAIFQAIKNDIPLIVKEITKANKNILWRSLNLEESRNMFASAIEHRQEEVARLLYEFANVDTNMVMTRDEDENNILHLAAKLAPRYRLGRISDSAFHLQSERRWFKGVGEIVPRSYHEHKNNNGETPLEVFVREHQDLLKEAEEWVKKTAESSTVIGALIITVMFAVAFTVPGGNESSTGFPILLHKAPIPFKIFMVSDAVSLFTASSSVITFLGILTTYRTDEDYHKHSLVIWGITYLFISIATMTIAFCAALFIMLQGRLVVVIPVTLVAGIPITGFVQLQFPLLVDIFRLILRPNIFGRRETSLMSWTADTVALGLRGALGALKK